MSKFDGLGGSLMAQICSIQRVRVADVELMTGSPA